MHQLYGVLHGPDHFGLSNLTDDNFRDLDCVVAHLFPAQIAPDAQHALCIACRPPALHMPCSDREPQAGAAMPSSLHCSADPNRGTSIHTDPLGEHSEYQALSPEDAALQHLSLCPEQLQLPHLHTSSSQLPEGVAQSPVPLLKLGLARCSVKMHESSECSQLAQSPQSARSSQSDATHLDHQDSYSSDSCWQDAHQQLPAGLVTSHESQLPASGGCQTPDAVTPEVGMSQTGAEWQAGYLAREESHTASTCCPELHHMVPGYSVTADPLASMTDDLASHR